MRLGYNTNGLAHHRLPDAINLLADEGYQSVAITLDAGALDPYQDPAILSHQVNQIRDLLDRRGMARVIETGARYLLNPRAKHDPTLMDPDPARRAIRSDFLARSIDLCKALGADCVSLWSGRGPDGLECDPGLERLAQALLPVLNHAEAAGVVLAFEPEPGMFVDSLEQFGRLDDRIRHPLFQLTIDLGHVHCLQEGHIPSLLSRWRSRVVNVHIEDMIAGVHEHLMFGEGTMDLVAICGALRDVEYRHGCHVELSRHSHMAVEAVRAAMTFLGPLTAGTSHQEDLP